MNPITHHEESPARVPLLKFSLAVLLQLGLALGAFKLFAPHAMAAEFARPWAIVLGTFLFGIPLSLFEYLYHRYLLHSAVLPFLASMHRAHGQHHSLTYVKAPVKVNEPAALVPVSNEFPVVHEHQEESMMFPYYALAIFYAMFLVLFALPLKLAMPGAPVVSSLIFAVTAFYCGYEIWHAVLHLPYDRVWQPLMESKRVGPVVQYVYGFHLMHHWRPTSNLAVVGLWGVAVWDHAFRTHRRPERLPLAGAEVAYVDAKLKKPLWPIAAMDSWQSAWYKWSRRVESWCARVFLRRA